MAVFAQERFIGNHYMEENTGLPVGWCFRPTDETVITDYLIRKVMGYSLSTNLIRDCDIYGDRLPWDIFNHYDERYPIWVFTRLKRSRNNVNVLRRVGGERGWTWHGENARKEIKNKDGVVVGFKKMFTLRKLNKEKNEKSDTTKWIMYEYSLGDRCDDVICNIKRKPGKEEQQRRRKQDFHHRSPLLSNDHHHGQQYGVSTTMSSMPSPCVNYCAHGHGDYYTQRDQPAESNPSNVDDGDFGDWLEKYVGYDTTDSSLWKI